jgi:hypothetical protein
MSNMAGQNQNKLNSLLAGLSDGWLAPSAWLQQRGYDRQLLAHYVKQGWLVSPARGVFHRAGSSPTWQTVVHSLQHLAELPLHVGGPHAISMHGLDHYLRMGAARVTLYGPAPLPAWVGALDLPERFERRSDARLGFAPLSAGLFASGPAQREVGLETLPGDRPDCPLVVSMPERAILEMLMDVPGKDSVAGADAIVQGMMRLRPDLLGRLLRECASVKVKRLFLALAERHNHAWFKHVDLAGVDLGKGNRVLGRGGRLHPTYRISLPKDLDEQLG